MEPLNAIDNIDNNSYFCPGGGTTERHYDQLYSARQS